MLITGSQVLFLSDLNIYTRAISSFLDGGDRTLYAVDNSAEPLLRELLQHPCIWSILVGEVSFVGPQIGAGADRLRADALAKHKSLSNCS